MIISVIGPSGSGKGTQAKLLSKKLGMPAISTGELLRDEFEKKSPEGIEAEKYWGKGEWAPEDLMMEILKKRLEKEDVREGFILDGTPRKMGDIPLLEDFLSQRGQKIDFIFHLDTSDDICLSRIQHRLFKAQEAGEKARGDEDIGKVKERLRQYHATIEPVLKYFEERGNLIRIDNAPPIEAVFEDISARIEELS